MDFVARAVFQYDWCNKKITGETNERIVHHTRAGGLLSVTVG